MPRLRLSRRSVLVGVSCVVLAVGVAVALLATRDERTSDEALLEEAAASLATTPLPNVGLGEASPPPPADLTRGWRTDFSRASIPFSEIASGGPPKDGIPAIDVPRFTGVEEVEFLDDAEPLILVRVGGATRAYPIQILIWHEIVNDKLGGVPVSVTFCPLCNTAIVFDRRVDGRILDFGTTGNLRNSDLVMYDRQTESWWQQFSGEAIVGELTGTRLDQLPARIVSWSEVRREYPQAKVLARPGTVNRPGDQTFSDRPYGSNPYTGYDDVSSPPFFPAEGDDDRRLQPKERVVFLEAGAEAVAVPFTALRERQEITVEIGGRMLVVRWRPGVVSALDSGDIASGRDVGAASVTEAGKPVAFHEPFWFAVAAFRPEVRIVR
jgi:hypothetical protein